MKEIKSINVMEKFSLFEKKWTPHIIGDLNGQYVKLCKLKDDFIWHKKFTERKLKFYGLSKLSNYQLSWISWIKGLVTGIMIAYLIFY